MKQLLLLSIAFCISATLFSQREHVNSDMLKFSIHDATYLNSYDGKIIPKIRDGLSRYTYKWIGPDNFVSTDSILVNIKPGTYVVRMNNGRCSFLCDTIEVMPRNNLFQNEKSFVVSRVHPNPFIEDVEILFRSNAEQLIQLEVFYSNGQVHSRQKINIDEGESTVKLDLSSVPAGIYVLNFCNTSNCKMTERIIKLN
jgi:hypothetical protein